MTISIFVQNSKYAELTQIKEMLDLINLILFLALFTIISVVLHKYAGKITNKNAVIKGSTIARVKLKPTNFVVIMLIGLFPSLLAGFRAYNVGIDTLSYVRYFNYNPVEFEMLTNNDYLFWKLFELCKDVFGDISITFFVIAFITYSLAFIAIFQMARQEHVGLVTFIYLCLFYQEGFNIIRQMLALSIIMLAIPYILERKPLKYVVFVFIAALCHLSAIICLPLYWFYHKHKISFIQFIGRIVSLLFIVICFRDIYSFVVQYSVFERFRNYGDQLINNSVWWKEFLLVMPIYGILVLMNKSIYHNEKSLQERPMYEYYWFLAIIYAVTLILRMHVNWVFRLGYYFEIGIILLLGVYIKRYVYQKRRTYMILVIIFFVMYYLFLNYHTNFDSSALVNYSRIK